MYGERYTNTRILQDHHNNISLQSEESSKLEEKKQDKKLCNTNNTNINSIV